MLNLTNFFEFNQQVTGEIATKNNESNEKKMIRHSLF